ncbi:hypothetical protein M3Y97_00666700 [Aphelenchoides bicaudatus]|nr:hypothetical protein M3Y97_00666700 [Aphelenchoides bicaudatus]
MSRKSKVTLNDLNVLPSTNFQTSPHLLFLLSTNLSGLQANVPRLPQQMKKVNVFVNVNILLFELNLFGVRSKTLKAPFWLMNRHGNIDDIVEDVPLKRKSPEEALIQIAKNPFAKGVERVAFYGRDNSPYFFMARTTNVVFKEFAHEYKSGKSRRFEVANHLQTIAAYLANRFCEDLRRQTGKRMTVEFLKTKTLIIKEESGQNRYLACEKRFASDARFIRFTNNVNYTILESKARELNVPLDYVELLMAFSHWTYKITDGMLMVVDLQGIVQKDANKTKIVLTDPAIHCIDSTRYGAMNLGRKGMDKFLERHKCNVYCEGLKLNE